MVESGNGSLATQPSLYFAVEVLLVFPPPTRQLVLPHVCFLRSHVAQQGLSDQTKTTLQMFCAAPLAGVSATEKVGQGD